MKNHPIMERAAGFIAAARNRTYPPRVIELAKICLVDWYGVALGARDERAGNCVRQVVSAWGGVGKAQMLFGGMAPAPLAALVNATYAHCLDFDDVHFPSLAHFSAPTWAATLALGQEIGATEAQMLSAFITGFEIGGRLGADGFGGAANGRGWHSTGVVGRLAAAASSATMLELDATRASHCLALAATQTSGLVASFGTDAKPFHAGRAGFDGIVSAQLAAAGMIGAPGILDSDTGLARAVVQDGSVRFRMEGLGEYWHLERNAIKPYASCGFTHAPIDAGRKLAAKLEAADAIARARIHVHPLAPKVAGQQPHSPLAAKFSLAYCVALALSGRHGHAEDFAPARLKDPSITGLLDKVEVVTHPEFEYAAARLEVTTVKGRELAAHIPASLGNPENPMSWADMREKFLTLVEPVLGTSAVPLFEALRDFDTPGRSAVVRQALAGMHAA